MTLRVRLLRRHTRKAPLRNVDVLKFYRRLLKTFGPQGWWPTTPASSLHPVYTPNKSVRNLPERERLEICLGAILTQNTNWTNVEKVLMGLKKSGHLEFHRLRRWPREKLEQAIRSSGYFRQKAQRLKNFLDHVWSEYHGSFRALLSGLLPQSRIRLLELAGIGPETADSMLLYAGGRPIFVVDAYTRRIVSRWGILRGMIDYNSVQDFFMGNLPRSPQIYGEVHALLVKLGKDFCRTKNPLCGECPLRKLCGTGRRYG